MYKPKKIKLHILEENARQMPLYNILILKGIRAGRYNFNRAQCLL
jgi:hypothetical protein